MAKVELRTFSVRSEVISALYRFPDHVSKIKQNVFGQNGFSSFNPFRGNANLKFEGAPNFGGHI